MFKRLMITTAVLALATTMAQAAPFTDQILADLTAQGFDHIEIAEGPSQIKVEAMRGTTRLEVVYDIATGKILKQEVDENSDDPVSPGVTIEDSATDFVGIEEENDDDPVSEADDGEDGEDSGDDDGGDDDGADSGDDDGGDDDGADSGEDDGGHNDGDDSGEDDIGDDDGEDSGEDDGDDA